MIIYAENPTSSAKAIKLICDFIKAALYNNNLFLKTHYFCVCSVAKSYQTLWDTMDWHARFPCPSQSLPKFLSIKSVMLSNHLILCHPVLLLPSIFPSVRVFSSGVSSSHLSTSPSFTLIRSGPTCGRFAEHHLYHVPLPGSLLQLHISAEMSLDAGSLLWCLETGMSILPWPLPNIRPFKLLFSCWPVCLLSVT